jgi:peptide/nickel transport system substrate-binding protein
MKIKRPVRLSRSLTAGAVALVAAGALVSACSSSSSSPSSPSSSAGASKTFTATTVGPIVSLDQTKDYGQGENAGGAQSIMLQPLESGGGLTKLVPELATSVSEPNDTTIVYTLRSGVKFSDGKPLTSADVVWSIEHAIAPTAQTASYLASVQGASATGANLVTVKLKDPNPAVRDIFASTVLIQEASFGQAHLASLGSPSAVPIGTGPYVVKSFTPQQVVMDRNPYYWGPKPVPGQVAFANVTGGDTAQQLALRSGELNQTVVLNPKVIGGYTSIPGTSVYSMSNLLICYIAINPKAAPFTDVHVRQAIAYSIDTQGLLAAAYGNQATIPKTLVPTEILDQSAPAGEVSSLLSSLPAYGFSLTKAKQQIAESRYPTGLSFTFYYANEMAWSQLVALNVQQNMAKIGVKVNVKGVPVAQYFGAEFTGHPNTPGGYLEAFYSPDLSGLSNVSLAVPANPSGWVPAGGPPLVNQLMTHGTQWPAARQIIAQNAQDAVNLPIFEPDVSIVVGPGWGYRREVSMNDYFSGLWVQLLQAKS